MRKKIIYTILVFSVFACSEEKPLPKRDIFEIKEVGELSSTEYIFSKVLQVDDKGEWYKFGDRKILISCKAKVKAGINLKQIQTSDLVEDGKTITITLPKPTITSFNMDPKSVKTEMMDISGMRTSFNQEEKNNILQLGEKAIQNSLDETGIYQQAEKNAISFVKEFYLQMGFENVIVKIKSSDEK